MQCYASFDIGGSGVKHGILDANGCILEKDKFSTPATLNELLAAMSKVLDGYKEKYAPIAVGISIPGAVDNSSGIIGGVTALDYIHHFDIKSLFETRFGLPVAMANDANCAALAEGWIGAAKGIDSYACVVIGTGVGGGLVQDGKLVSGAHQHGGEFGYWIMDPFSRTNWSDLGSTRILLQKAAWALGVDEIEGVALFKLANEGNPLIHSLLEEFYFINALGIYNLQHAADPTLILIGGGISQQPQVIAGINNQLAILLSKGKNMRVEVKACQFLNDANLIGAVYHYLMVNKHAA